ncbi:MAG: Adventurous gliding motility protein C [uncultured bacterium]|uniref:SGNH/GDSL hydrolase family protein n=1 Tax=candidate division WWE3 bacterium TaxID=2053526 RepID=A0A656PNK8_UNCKA|nr:GDSL family lipase [candidate division WWE3 bacterium RAAC2_WWE3_1]EKD94660.1 MAG: Adventurous gliding motility protein C [uncultured bacterium]OGC67275.1 MAG: hypothetical protein A2364_01965 [candidate division WWE3 bacterium RIFOXYB1_FULL_43_12]HAI95565.1 SGNH/GDSL hydrolase family protein [candidate division WWE3 bacterium]HAU99065.1 SGNH/GDSL hydrolase family protein [Candidatus Paceibacterota bacterium]
MRFIKFVFPAGLVLLYLYLSYAGFYNNMKEKNLQSVFKGNLMIFDNPDAGGSVKYVALGDSLSAGVGSESMEETIVYLFASELSKTYGKVNAVNLALPGGTTEDVINDQLPFTISEKPDYVTLLIGVNDIHNKRTEKDFRENYSLILNELVSKTEAKIVVINLPYLGADKAILPPYSWILNSRTQKFNKVISELVTGNESRIRLVDLYGKTYKISKQVPGYYSSDLFHPSGKAYLLWSQFINEN